MSEPSGRGYKTIAVRLPDDEHAQLVLIAALEELSLNDTLRMAVQRLIATKRDGGDLAAQAAKALEEMEAEAATKRAALQAGAMGASISGAGPSVFAWCESRSDAEHAATGMAAAFAQAGFDSDVHITPIAGPAATVIA